MVTTLTLVVAALALVIFVLFGAVLELYRDVRQLRDAIGILDRPLDVVLGPVKGTRPSRHGLFPALDDTGSAVVLFLSDRCATCRTLAAGLTETGSSGLWVVLEARTMQSAEGFLETHGAHGLDDLRTEGRFQLDVAGAIARSMGLRTTPVVIRVQDGRFTSATTAPSRRYLASILPRPVHLERSATPSAIEEGRKAS